MTTQQIIDPAQIEPELLRIWDQLAKENKTRASLFNLIVFNHLSARTDYIRNIVQKVVEKFPCRILFISYDPDTSQGYLKTAVSVITPKSGESAIACDLIDVGVAGPELHRVPYVITPHIIPDLPIYLLWSEDPCKPHELFAPLSELAHRIIFDSESADSLLAFSKKLLSLKKEKGKDIADLNWARTEGWRDLIASTFDSDERLKQLDGTTAIQITYNAKETQFFCHLKIQSMYLLAWLSSRLKWTLEKASPNLLFEYKNGGHPLSVSIQTLHWEKLGPGTIVSFQLTTEDQHVFECQRIPTQYHRVAIHISCPQKCDLPYHYELGQTATGQSLVKEIINQGTSAHYLEMLSELNRMDEATLC